MNKEEFLKLLRMKLKSLPRKERDGALEFYSELIRDGIDSGETEEEVISRLGDIDSIAARIISESPSAGTRKRFSTTAKVFIIIALVLGSPIWLSVIVSIFSVVISVAAALFSVLVSLYGTAIALLGTFIYCFVSSFFLMASSTLGGLFRLGLSIMSLGLGALLTIACYELTKLFIKLIKTIFSKIIRLFQRQKGGEAIG